MAVLFICWAPPAGAETRGLEHLAFGIRQILCLGEAHKEEGVSGVPTASAQSASLSTPHSPAQFPMLRHVHPRPLPKLSSGGVVEAGMCSWTPDPASDDGTEGLGTALVPWCRERQASAWGGGSGDPPSPGRSHCAHPGKQRQKQGASGKPNSFNQVRHSSYSYKKIK